MAEAFFFGKSLRKSSNFLMCRGYTFATRIRRDDGIKRVEDK